MARVFERLVGQHEVVAELSDAAAAAREGDIGSRMTHSWLFTGPPGSGRSIAAVCFAAALQCTDSDVIGCGHCHACTTTMHGTHGDVRRIVPQGLSISVKEMREVVQMAARRPTTGTWQIVVIEDADRLGERAYNALLKAVEEPPARTIFLLCAPSVDPEDIAVTIRSRCRHVALVTPKPADIARVLRENDGLDEKTAAWAASVGGGHVGRARRLATDPEARERRQRALGIAKAALRPATQYAVVEELVKAAESDAVQINADRDERETDELRTSLGAGGTGKGAAGALRGSAGVLKELEQRQKSRRTRTGRDSLDRALIDLAGLYRDALAQSYGASSTMTHPDMEDQARGLASVSTPESLLQCIEAILRCREALEMNVKPKFAVDAMVATLGAAAR
ncbi:DNA polymerase III subunit delta' [Rhodococcus sp. BP-241]|uniref:DNA polymerase III subunit delta' n=1 Tax=Rhodococcus sp. BP-241 TaxID=2739441 RepID=UPI001C9B28EE|nr:DNA polymerase III subunit delta' [Rhodococcus sp. BP-241]MBY6709052.1 DNA polymerase III subunit delta' [Rhodococcus sp. BP-241]